MSNATRRKTYRERNKVAVREAHKDWSARNLERRNFAAQARRYGLTPDELRSLLERQLGRCAICGGSDRLTVDHCHNTSVVRGILCANCNCGIGYFRDNPELLAAAIKYLKRS